MAIQSYDIVSTLQALGMMKYWKGKHIILKKQVSMGKLHKQRIFDNICLTKKRRPESELNTMLWHFNLIQSLAIQKLVNGLNDYCT